MGPVEYIVVAFPGNEFNGDVLPALVELIDSNTVRLLDLLFIGKDADGTVLSFEIDDLQHLADIDELNGEVGGLISPSDVEHVAASLDPNSSAALLIWEDVWAEPFATAVRDSGGVLIEGARIPLDVIESAMADLPQAV
ncbi:MAG: DUF6325 family protein [Acidimicrobiales bacterium]|jgi:hypothetical protein